MFGADEEGLLVFKNGMTTGTTIGRATHLESIVRTMDKFDICGTSWEVPIHSCGGDVFSDRGDSGAIIADGKGRIVGLLTGGTTSQLETADVSYASPFYWVFERIKAKFPKAYLYQTNT